MNDKTSHPDDDLAWFDALAGRAAPQASPETRREADCLRAVVLRTHVQSLAEETVPDDERDRTDRLVQRARASGLIEPCRPCAERSRWWTRQSRQWADAFAAWWPHLGGAVALIVAIGTVWQWRGPTEPDESPLPVERGNVIQPLRAADPHALREKLMAELRAAGAEVQPYERLGRVGLDVDLPRPVPQALADVAARYGLRLDSDLGVLAVEIESTSAAPAASQ